MAFDQFGQQLIDQAMSLITTTTTQELRDAVEAISPAGSPRTGEIAYVSAFGILSQNAKLIIGMWQKDHADLEAARLRIRELEVCERELAAFRQVADDNIEAAHAPLENKTAQILTEFAEFGKPQFAPADDDFAMIREFEAVTAADYPERLRG